MAMKVTKKKQMRKSSQGERALNEKKSDAKAVRGQSVSKMRRETASCSSDGNTSAMQREGADGKPIVEVAKKPVPSGLSACEPEGRGAPPPLPTPIATFNF